MAKPFLTQQLQNVADVLTFDNYDYTKVGSTFTFTGSTDCEIVVDSTYVDGVFQIDIDTQNINVRHTFHKPIDTAYFAYMLRSVPGTNNYTQR